MSTAELQLKALPGIPDVQVGDDIVALILAGLGRLGWDLQDGDVFTVSSKIISKADGRFVDLKTIEPSVQAQALATRCEKDPRFVEMVLRESTMVSRVAHHALIVRHRLGFVSANAGIDQSNLHPDAGDIILLLPKDPDTSARHIGRQLFTKTGKKVGVIVTDTHGRPFRLGNVNVAIGVYGMAALLDQRGQPDRYGRIMQATVTGYADQVASAAGLLTGEAAEGQPVVVIRGLSWRDFPEGTGKDIVRPLDQDLYLQD